MVFETLRQSPWFYAQALKLHAFTTMKVQFHGGYEIRSLEKTAILRVVLDSLQKKRSFYSFWKSAKMWDEDNGKKPKGHYNNIYSLMDYSSSESCICHPPQRWPAPSKHFLLGKSTCYIKCIKCIFCSSNFRNFPNFRDFELSQKSLVEKVTWLIALFWLAKRVNERDFFLLWAKLRPLAKRFWLAESQQTLNNKSTLNCQCQYCVNTQQTKLKTLRVESVSNSKNSWNRLGDFWTRFEWFVFKNLLPGKTEWSKCTKDISARICQW